ncbi:DUF2750 domain-containing protein [Streptomyces sp. NPDC005195]|uniref:DUF2750 domain-containing protein n=1 Tax=Streptomyces sp. NPDC005195 TaxID=3154561 RepID=UPI0033A7A53E
MKGRAGNVNPLWSRCRSPIKNSQRNGWWGGLGSVAMSQSGSQAAAFFRDVRQSGVVWLVRDDDGSPTSLSSDGTRSLPFWSTSARAQRAAKIWGHDLRVESVSLEDWRARELPDVAREGLMVGINWSGPRLVGWSFTPTEVLNRLAAADQSRGRSAERAVASSR